MSKTDKFMPLYVSDYLADTMHLSTAEHGAYLLLIMHYWRTGDGLTVDDAQLARISRCTSKNWQKMKPAILSFFVLIDGKYRHKRIDRQLSIAIERYQLQIDRGKSGAAKRWAKSLKNKDAAMLRPSFQNASSIKQAMLKNSQPEPEPYLIDKSISIEAQTSFAPTQNARFDENISCKIKVRGSRWPDGAIVPDDWLKSGELARLKSQLPAIDLRSEALKFANYWAAKSGGGATKIDWQRTWINWALNARGTQNGERTERKSQLEQIADIARRGLAGTIIND